MAHRSLDEKGARQVNGPNEQERENLMDSLWYERRDDSTLDEKLMRRNYNRNILKITETIKQNRTNITVVPIARVALDAQPGKVSPTLALLAVMAQDLACRKEREPRQTYQTWH